MSKIEELLEKSRDELLDLSTRNRLLSMPVGTSSARLIEVRDELCDQVFRLLVGEKKTFTFLPGRRSANSQKTVDENDEEVGLPQPDDTEDEETGLAKRHIDLRLQTSLSPEGLQRRLFDLNHDAAAMIEEQGVNILYLALGKLKWFEVDHADIARYAPLILVPVELDRRSASEKFCVKWTGDDIEENLSLRAKLSKEFSIELPDFPDEEEMTPTAYFAKVRNCVAEGKNWAVLENEMTLGFFSFAKFLMYRDLDPENWPNRDLLLGSPLVSGLLSDGFSEGDLLLADDASIDEVIPASKLDHVVDADSSQSIAIESVRRGRSLVIQGPPGTGKSQSITNIISTAVFDKKRVLFVAEKLAALEVVKRRLEREGLGSLCLELHSNKARKRDVIDEIGKTWNLGRPMDPSEDSLVVKLEGKRRILNEHVNALHTSIAPSGYTPFEVLGHLAVLGQRGKQVNTCAFENALDWTKEQRLSYRKRTSELSERVQEIGLPSQHPWRGVKREVFLNIDLDPIAQQIQRLGTLLGKVRGQSSELADTLSQPVPPTLARIREQLTIASFVADSPQVDKQAICHTVWGAGVDGIRELLKEVETFSNVSQSLSKDVIDSAWEKDFSTVRTQIAAHGQSLFRFLNGQYRSAIAELKGVLKTNMPGDFAKRLELIDSIVQAQCALVKIKEADSLGKNAFGSLWLREKSNWNQLGTILEWVVRQTEIGLGESFREMFAGVADVPSVKCLKESLANAVESFDVECQKVFSELSLDVERAFGLGDIHEVSLDEIEHRLKLWNDNMSILIQWNKYFICEMKARQAGLGALVEHLVDGRVQYAQSLDCFDRIYFSQLLRDIAAKNPQIAHFDGQVHEKLIQEFRELDKARLALAKYQTLISHYERLPSLNAGVGATGIVKSEMERKRGFRSVRRLLKEAGSVVQAIKPVFMMSPLSVAQYLEPGAVDFDLLVIDEASQVQPVDALGAVARCKQIVVVGDSKQLPPTRFFARLTSDGVPDDEDETEPAVAMAQDMESILGLCKARGLPEKMLRWHYRSRHHSLIAVSNHEFYEDKLFIVPSPYAAGEEMGLKFHYISEGVFDSGASGTNRVEAKAVCKAIMQHAKNTPKLSLGVAAFSVRQRQAILDELELMRRENPQTESFFSNYSTEPFFVKNLENVQGDERDVIFISVGYGKNANGYMAMRFGPLGSEGGERRLNVLISRAKKRCEVFTSITSDDIDLERASGRGVASLKTFLNFAQTGRLSVPKRTNREEDSPFEEAVKKAIESLGYEVDCQVGIAGFFVDLAVLDRSKTGRYLLGVECDGASYHSSCSARDRDRLRQAVLEDHGWIIHRIWSADWFQSPDEQIRKLQAAIEQAKMAVIQAEEELAAASQLELTEETTDLNIERESTPVEENGPFGDLSVPYVEASFPVPDSDPHALPTHDLAQIVLQIVKLEGPIHEDELVNRIRNLWNFSRAGSRIQDAVEKAVRHLRVTQQCSREDACLFLANAKIPIRNRELVTSAALRKPDMLPPMEIRTAILALISASHGAAKDEICIAVSRMFGFKATSAQLKSTILSQLKNLVSHGKLANVEGILKLPVNAG